MKTLFRKSLKAVLLLAVLSICAPNVWAQDVLKSGQVTFQYYHHYSSDYYLCAKRQYDQTCAAIDENAESLYLNMISESRYLIALAYNKHKDFTLGYYLLSTATEDMGFEFDPAPDKDIAENSYLGYRDNIDATLRGHLIFVWAIHMGDYLYVADDPQKYNIWKLDELVEAGTIKKIDLNKANNFIFSFVQPEKGQGYLEGSVIITSESGGTIMIDDNNMAKIRGKSLSTSRQSSFIPEQIKEDKIDHDEVKTGFSRFQYFHPTFSDLYLCGSDDEFIPDSSIYISNEVETNVFYLDTIGKGRYLMALNYEEKEGYSKGRYMLNPGVFPEIISKVAPPLPYEILENCFYKADWDDRIITTEAIRIADTLYITAEMPASMSVLNDMVKAGRVKKINLSKPNNFIFSFCHFEDSYGTYPEGAIVITSEIGGDIAIEAFRGRAKINIDAINIHYDFFFPKPLQEDVRNAYIESTAKVALYDNTLTINSPDSERINIYSMSGALIFSKQKPEGEVKYQINGIPQGVIIVKSSSGWVEKVVKM